MFDIINYNFDLLIIFSLGLFIIIFLLFKRYLNSLIDPLIYHIFWLSLGGSLIFAYPSTHSNLTIVYIIIVIQYLVYIFALFYFYKIFSKKTKDPTNLNKYYFKTSLLIFLLIIYLFAKKSFIIFAINANSIEQIFLWRILFDFQGRDPIERIFLLGGYPFLLFIVFFQIKYKTKNYLSKVVLLIILIIEILSGGRSSILTILFSYGAFMLIYSKYFSKKDKRKVFLSFGITIFILFIYISIIKTTQYVSGTDINPMYATLNRFFATYDGIDYYLTYDGLNHIKYGVSNYFMSIFGIYVQNIMGISYKNIGWQLSELASGSSLSFAQGSNFTFLLQGLVLSPYIAIFYSIFIALISALFRYSFYIQSAIFKFALIILSYRIVSDIEFAVLTLISLLIIFTFIKTYTYIQRLKL